MTKSKTKKGIQSQLKTVQTWKGVAWLGYEVSPDGLWVTKVWCNICRDHAKSAKSALNTGQSHCCKDLDAYIVGTYTVKRRNIFDHGGSAIHTKAVTAKCAKESPATSEIGAQNGRCNSSADVHAC